MQAPEKLKQWRDKRKGEGGKPLSQVEAARKVGASGPAWCDWELGKKIPDIEKAAEIEKLTGIRVREWAAIAKRKREERESQQAARKAG